MNLFLFRRHGSGDNNRTVSRGRAPLAMEDLALIMLQLIGFDFHDLYIKAGVLNPMIDEADWVSIGYDPASCTEWGVNEIGTDSPLPRDNVASVHLGPALRVDLFPDTAICVHWVREPSR